MIRSIIVSLIIALQAIATAARSDAAIVNASMAADTQARIRTATDSDASTALIDTVSSYASIDNSYTSSSLAYSFNAATGVFTSSATLTAEKTVSARRGGDHVAVNSMVLNFEVDADTNFSMVGNWGFTGASLDPGDSLTYALIGPGGTTVFSSSTASNGGVGSAAFNETELLGVGAYQLTFQSSLEETFNRQDFAQAGWTIQNMSLSQVSAIPEPSGLLFFGLVSIALVVRRRR